MKAATGTSVTVVVMSRDRREQALRSLGRLVGEAGAARVVFVDNGSSDGTAQAVNQAFPDVVVVPLPRNVGAQARNVGVLLADTAYVAFSDDDSWWAGGSLARAVRLLERHPRLGLVMGRVLVGPDGVLDPVCEGMAAAPLGHPPGVPHPRVLGFLACGAVVRREAFLAVGGFSGVVRFPGEEELLALDLAADGWDLVYAEDVVARHLPTRSAGRSGRRAGEVRSRLLTAWLRRPPRRALASSWRTLRDAQPADAVLGLLGATARMPLVARRHAVLPPAVEGQLEVLGR